MEFIANCNNSCVFPVPFLPKISTIIPSGIPPERDLSNFAKPVEIICVIIRKRRKNLRNFYFFKGGKAFILENKVAKQVNN